MAITRRTRRLARFLHREEGQAAFEFLLLLPTFVIFLLLLVDFGVVMYEYVSVSNAAREGARYGAVNCGTGTCTELLIQQRAVDRSGGILSDINDVEVDWVDNGTPPDAGDRGDSVVVRIRHTYEFLFFFGVTMDVRSCSDMRLEQRDRNAPFPAGGTGCP